MTGGHADSAHTAQGDDKGSPGAASPSLMIELPNGGGESKLFMLAERKHVPFYSCESNGHF